MFTLKKPYPETCCSSTPVIKFSLSSRIIISEFSDDFNKRFDWEGIERTFQESFAKLKMVCAVFAILFSGTVLGVVNLNSNVSDILKYGTTLSADDFGFPVDSYGLLMVE